MADPSESSAGPASAPGMPRAFAVFTAACLVVAIVAQAGALDRTLRWFVGEAVRTQPYELRLLLNDWFRDAVLAARAIDAEVPVDIPVLLDDTQGEAWFVGLRLQPRRVFLDRPRVRARLAEVGEPFVVVHLRRFDGRTWWWFDVIEDGGIRRIGSRPPLIRREGFEGDNLEGWGAVGAGGEP